MFRDPVHDLAQPRTPSAPAALARTRAARSGGCVWPPCGPVPRTQLALLVRRTVPPHHRQGARADDVGQHLPGAHRGQLVHVAHQQQRGA